MLLYVCVGVRVFILFHRIVCVLYGKAESRWVQCYHFLHVAIIDFEPFLVQKGNSIENPIPFDLHFILFLIFTQMFCTL